MSSPQLEVGMRVGTPRGPATIVDFVQARRRYPGGRMLVEGRVIVQLEHGAGCETRFSFRASELTALVEHEAAS